MRSHRTTPHWLRILATFSISLAFGSSPMLGADERVMLSGSVVDEQGMPVAAARVLVLPWAVSDVVDRAHRLGVLASVMTDGNGRFTVSEAALLGADTPPDRHVRLWAEKGRRSSSRRVVLLNAAEAMNLRFALRPTLDIGVSVEREDGETVGGVDVVLDLAEVGVDSDDGISSHYRITVTTDEKGAASPSGLPDGTYRGVQALVRHQTRPISVNRERITLWREDGFLRVKITLPRLLRIVGQLLESDGRPARGLQVVDWSETADEAPLSRMVHAGASGRFVLSHVARTASRLIVCSESDGQLVGTRSVWPRVVKMQPLALSAVDGDEMDIGVIRLPERRTVRVRIVDVDGRPVRCRAVLRRMDIGFGATSVQVEESGLLKCRDVSRENVHVLEVHADSTKWGSIKQGFSLASEEDALTVRVTGAGMLIIRFFSSTQPRRRVALDSPTVVWLGRNQASSTVMEVADEVRMWVGTRDVGRVELRTRGNMSFTSDTVSIVDDEPTVVEIAVPGT